MYYIYYMMISNSWVFAAVKQRIPLEATRQSVVLQIESSR